MVAITPNGDGINDRWLVGVEGCYVNAAVHIYNRYGSAIYDNNNYKNDWMGTYKNKPIPDGTYYFIIEFTLNNGRKHVVKGNLTILR
jgi:gliding motility-associated-like protein